MSSPATAEAPNAQGHVTACPSCQAPTEFDPKSGHLRCTYCPTTTHIARPGEVPRHALAELDGHAAAAAPEGRKHVSCTNCGAVAVVGQAEVSLRCIYCLASLTVSTAAQPLAAVDGVLPFSLTREEAKDRFAKWLKELWFAPNELAAMAKLQGLRAIYAPAWVFSAHVRTRWTAHVGFLTTADEDRKAGRPRPPGDPDHVRTRWEDLSGTREATYPELVISASQGLPSKELRTIEPFDLKDGLAPFHPGFLAGFDAELPGLAGRRGWEEALERIRTHEEAECEDLVPGDEHKRLKVFPSTSDERFALALLPIFVVAYAYRGEIYRVLVNGRTGAVEGDQPLSAWKVGALLTVIGLVVLAIAALFA